MGGGAHPPGSPQFGSVWEWTEDFDGAPVSGRTSDAAASNLFCGAGVRAADASDYGGFLRYSFRSSLRAAYTLKNLGFRCARDAR
jgi:formylglycine-generating enzyme required for sulfatase activity